MSGQSRLTRQELIQRVLLGFNFKNIACNNLGGAGPDKNCEEGIRYSGVSTISGRPVDLVVTTTSDYNPESSKDNGGKKSVSINVNKGDNIIAKFTIVNGGAIESVRVQGLARYDVQAPSDVGVGHNPDGSKTFRSKVYGAGFDNPESAMGLSSAEMAKSVSLLFKATSSSKLSFAASPSGFKGTTGRDFKIGGSSNIVCPSVVVPKKALCATMTCPAGFRIRRACKV